MVSSTLAVALVAYVVGCLQAVAALLRRRREPGYGILVPVSVGVLAHTASLGAVCVVYGGWPVGAASESFSFISWSLALLAVLVAARYRSPVLLGFALPLAALTAALALALQEDVAALTTLAAVPRGAWLWVHIVLSLIAVAALMVSALAGLAYLLQEGQLKSRRPGFLSSRLPSLETCDRAGHQALSVGFALLTAGFLAGVFGVWSRLGPDWTWDLTQALAVAAWALYLAVLYWRWTVGLRGRRAAWLAIVGSLSVTAILVGVVVLSGRFHPGGGG